MSALSALSLIHVTDAPPQWSPEGIQIETGFRRHGGFAQPIDQRFRTRQTLHYTLQSAVTDHAYGSFENKRWAVVAPFDRALEANGRPESLLASDVAFFPQEGRMTLPGASILEFSPDIPSDLFIRSTPTGFQVAKAFTPENIPQARQWLEKLSLEGHDVTALQKKLSSPEALSSPAAFATEVAVASALAQQNRPSLSALRNIEPGSAMGFDGWMPRHELVALAKDIEASTPSSEMGAIKVGRHDGTPGDQLAWMASRLNLDGIKSIRDLDDAPPRIQEAASAWLASPLMGQRRAKWIRQEILEGDAVLANDNGAERPGLVGALYGAVPANDFVHPTVGRVHRLEADQALFELSLDERRQFVQKVDDRLQGGTQMAASFSRLRDWTDQSLGQNMASAPPPVPAGPPPLPSIAFPSASQWREARSPCSTVPTSVPSPSLPGLR